MITVFHDKYFNPQLLKDKYPDCNASPHNTNHLFNCQMKPTSLTPIDLWTNLDLVASYLDSRVT